LTRRALRAFQRPHRAAGDYRLNASNAVRRTLVRVVRRALHMEDNARGGTFADDMLLARHADAVRDAVWCLLAR